MLKSLLVFAGVFFLSLRLCIESPPAWPLRSVVFFKFRLDVSCGFIFGCEFYHDAQRSERGGGDTQDSMIPDVV